MALKRSHGKWEIRNPFLVNTFFKFMDNMPRWAIFAMLLVAEVYRVIRQRFMKKKAYEGEGM